MGLIEDGAGSGKKVKVNKENRLQTETISVSEEAKNAFEKGLCFVVTLETQITNPAGAILYLKNTSSTKTMVIETFMISTSAASTVLEFRKNDTGTPGTTTTLTQHNTNFASGLTAEADCYTTSGTAISGLTAGMVLGKFHNVPVGVMQFPVDSTFVLEKNNSLTVSVTVTGSVGFGIRYRFVDPTI